MKSDTLIKFPWYYILKGHSYDCDKAYNTLTKIIMGRYGMSDTAVNDCWLDKPVEFLVSAATVQQKCVYLHIATRRNLATMHVKSVPIYIVEDMYNIETLHTNPLLTVTDKDIILKY